MCIPIEFENIEIRKHWLDFSFSNMTQDFNSRLSALSSRQNTIQDRIEQLKKRFELVKDASSTVGIDSNRIVAESMVSPVEEIGDPRKPQPQSEEGWNHNAI